MGDRGRHSYTPGQRRLLEILEADPAARSLSTSALAKRGGVSWWTADVVRKWAGASPATVVGRDGSRRPGRTPRPRKARDAGPDPNVSAVAYGDGWRVVQADCLEWLRSLPAGSADLVFGSPPYLDARTYGRGDVARDCESWVAWMLDVTAAAVRVSRGLVLWVVAGATRGWQYQPAPELLLAEWWRRGGACWRPAYWHRSGTPGAGGRQWLRPDVDTVLAFAGRGGPVPFADPTANGAPPRGHAGRTCRAIRRPTGKRATYRYREPDLANPGNLVSVPTGGGRLGSDLASGNEAPMPEALAAWFVRAWCPPGGRVVDPFAGSGTTGAAALTLGRQFAGCDVRACQVELSARRVAGIVLQTKCLLFS